MEDADLFVYVDVEAILPRNFKAFMALPGKAVDAPELRDRLNEAVAAAGLGRTAFKATTGVDPIDDIRSVAAWLKWDGAAPKGVVCVRGDFDADYVTKVPHLASGIGPEGLAPGATTPPIVLKSTLGYTGTQARVAMLQNREYVDARVEVFGKHGRRTWIKLQDLTVARHLLTE